MARNQRRLALIAGVLGVVAVYVIISAMSQPASSSPSTSAAVPRAVEPRGSKVTEPAEALKLDDLKAPRPDPVEGGRNPFQFKARAVPAPPPRPTPTTGRPGGPGVPQPAPPPLPMVPAGPPAIGLKFIGIVEAPAQGGRLAVLSDGRSVFYGHEGDVVDGRFRIAKIGVESIEMMYVDGRGRQTIRLSGQ